MHNNVELKFLFHSMDCLCSSICLISNKVMSQSYKASRAAQARRRRKRKAKQLVVLPKPLKVPSLARSVPKPLKVPSLSRSVPKP